MWYEAATLKPVWTLSEVFDGRFSHSAADTDFYLSKSNMSLFAGLLRARRALANRAGVMVQQRAGYINSRPPKDNIGPAVSLQVA